MNRVLGDALLLPELSGGHVVSSEEAVSGVPQVLTELLIQLLQHNSQQFSITINRPRSLVREI